MSAIAPRERSYSGRLADSRVDRNAGGYAALAAVFNVGFAIAVWVVSRNRSRPLHLGPQDVAFGGLAVFRLSRLIGKGRVTSPLRRPFVEVDGSGAPGEVREHVRREAPLRAVGELLTCPYCLDVWLAASYVIGLASAPDATRLVAGAFATNAVADALQQGYVALDGVRASQAER